jgi:hypothetical protein
MKWNILWRNSDFGHPYLKPHVVSEEFTDVIVKSFLARGVPDIQWKKIPGCVLDLRAPENSNQFHHTFDIDGLEIMIPSSNMIYFFNEIQDLEERDDVDVPYFKVHGGYVALCLDYDQREALLIQMSSELREAQTIAQFEHDMRQETLSKTDETSNVVSLADFKKKKRVGQ